MSSTGQRKNHDIGDRQLTAEYRRLATETAPRSLRQKVLLQAAAEQRDTGSPGLFGRWVRPLAFAATAGLCVAIMLDLSQRPDSMYPPPADAPTAGPGAETKTGRGAASALTDAAEVSGRQLRELDETLGSAGPTESARYCDGQQTESPARWWRCIEQLRQAGELAAAQHEYRLLQRAHPDYRPPQ